MLYQLMRLERGCISLKQNVMLNGLAKAHWTLTVMFRD